jgi:hypothetical protein
MFSLLSSALPDADADADTGGGADVDADPEGLDPAGPGTGS